MAEATERRGELATEPPNKYLPAVEYRDLPEPVRPLELGELVEDAVRQLSLWRIVSSVV
jgi:hypothetical protein